MDPFPWKFVFAALILFLIAAFVYEFVPVGRRRLGFRVQLDTPATPGVLQLLRHKDGQPLIDPSLVLLRIENRGMTSISESDYAPIDDRKAGIRVVFRGRRVVGMTVMGAGLSFRESYSGEVSGMDMENCGVIDLPRVPLNPSGYYKVLVVLERISGERDDGMSFASPEVIGEVGSGRIRTPIEPTPSHTQKRTWPAVALIGFLITTSILLGYLSNSVGNPSAGTSHPGAGHTQTLTTSPSPGKPSATAVSPGPGTAPAGDDHGTAFLTAIGTFIAGLGAAAGGVAAILALLRRRDESR